MLVVMLLMLVPQQVMATGFGDYPALPGMPAGGMSQLNSLYPPLAGVPPMTANPLSAYPQSGGGNSWTAPPQSAMPNSLFSLFQSQPTPPSSAMQPFFSGAQSLPQDETNRSGWPQAPQQTPYGAQGISALEGMWQGSNGEMIAIKENRFLYSDQGTQKFSGYLSIGRDRFQATMPSSNAVANYEYWLKDNKLTVRDEAGRVLYFQRVYR